MDRTAPLIAEPALILRPLPSYMVPASKTFYFGGKPRLPDDLEWPVDDLGGSTDHFFAQIDLSALPRAIDVDGVDFAIPEFPATGTLFIFLPLGNLEAVYEGNLTILFSNKDLTDVVERDPPELLRPIPDGYHCVDLDGVKGDGKLLVRQDIEILPYLSSRAENPLFRNMERADPSVDLGARDDAHALQEWSLDRVLASIELPLDGLVPMEELVFNSNGSRTTSLEGRFMGAKVEVDGYAYSAPFDQHMTWEFIFDWAKRMRTLCFEIAIKQMRELDLDDDEIDPVFERLKRDNLSVKQSVYTPKHASNPWAQLPNPRDPLDVQALAWFKLAQVSKGTLTQPAAQGFFAMIRHAVSGSTSSANMQLAGFEGFPPFDDTEKAQAIRALTAMEYATGKAEERYCATEDVYKLLGTQEQIWDHTLIKAQTPPPPEDSRFNFGGGPIPTQMFGAAYLMQHAAIEHADKVLLLQLYSGFGLPLSMDNWDTVIQIWIDPEDLRQGLLHKCVVTAEST